MVWVKLAKNYIYVMKYKNLRFSWMKGNEMHPLFNRHKKDWEWAEVLLDTCWEGMMQKALSKLHQIRVTPLKYFLEFSVAVIEHHQL